MSAKLVYIYNEDIDNPDVMIKSYLMSDGEIVYDTDVKSLVDVHISTDDFNSTSYVFVYHKDIENYFKDFLRPTKKEKEAFILIFGESGKEMLDYIKSKRKGRCFNYCKAF
jgi:hypothetical protein